MRVLVIEDDPEFLTFLRVYIDGLESIDQVRYASSGADGIQLAQESRFDVVVMDYQLQDMTGEQVARSIRDLPDCPRVIGFSGSTERLDWADTVLTKGGRESLDLLKQALSSP